MKWDFVPSHFPDRLNRLQYSVSRTPSAKFSTEPKNKNIFFIYYINEPTRICVEWNNTARCNNTLWSIGNCAQNKIIATYAAP